MVRNSSSASRSASAVINAFANAHRRRCSSVISILRDARPGIGRDLNMTHATFLCNFKYLCKQFTTFVACLHWDHCPSFRPVHLSVVKWYGRYENFSVAWIENFSRYETYETPFPYRNDQQVIETITFRNEVRNVRNSIFVPVQVRYGTPLYRGRPFVQGWSIPMNGTDEIVLHENFALGN